MPTWRRLPRRVKKRVAQLHGRLAKLALDGEASEDDVATAWKALLLFERLVLHAPTTEPGGKRPSDQRSSVQLILRRLARAEQDQWRLLFDEYRHAASSLAARGQRPRPEPGAHGANRLPRSSCSRLGDRMKPMMKGRIGTCRRIIA